MKKIITDDWCKCANIAMLLNNKDTADIAEDLGYTRQFVAGIVSGSRKSPAAKIRISNYLGIRADPDRKVLKSIKNILNKEKSM